MNLTSENAGLGKPANKSMLKQRIITALILAPVLLAIVIYNHPIWFAALVGIIQAAATYEWLKINQVKPHLAITNGIVIAVATAYFVTKSEIPMAAIIMGYSVIWLLALLWLKNHKWGYENNSFQLLTKGLLGVAAIVLFAWCINKLYAMNQGHWLTLALFFLIWVADIGAYVSGKTMGKHKLAINISPGKTWEGVIGAQILVAIYAIVISHILALNWYFSLLMMIPIALFSVVGDLAASLGKRQAQVKDSSQLLPGHGGFIDRFDSLIAAAPLFLMALSLL